MKIFLLLCLLVSSVSASELKLESISIKDSNQPEELDEHRGDYIVEVKVRNISKNPVQVSRYSVSTSFVRDGSSNQSGGVKYDSNFHKYNSLCCHPELFDTIEVNQVYTLRFRDSSRNKGKKMFLSMRGKQGIIQIGSYIL